MDEVNSMSLPLQAKLLRVLQEMTVRPLGGRKEYPVNFRLICASNEEPEVLLQEKRLRDDLFYRIAGFCLWIPPLRERTEDILELAWLFIQRYNREFGRHITSMAPELETWLRKRPWPGNTRELQNAIQNMMLKAWDSESELSLRHIPSYARNTAYAGGEERGGKTAEGEAASGPVDLNGELKRCQRRLIEEQLERCGYNMTKTAENLGIGRQNLLSRMKRLDIEKKKKQK